MNIGNLTAILGLDTTEFDRKLAGSVSHLQKAGGNMQQVGKKLGMFVTAPLVALGAASFKTSMDFESSMSKIVGLVGVAEDEVRAWNDEVLRMSGDVAKSPTELADALFFITSAGVRGAEAMDTLNIAARASAAGLGETKTIADLVTSAMNAYGSDVLDASQATDILVSAVREGKAEASELAGSMGQVLPIASEMGVGFDQVGAAIAAMTRTGTDASTASTQLRAVLGALLKPSKQAEDALASMGMSSKQLRQQLREKGLVSVLGTLKSSMEGNDEAMAQVFGNVRALSGVLDIMGANAEDNIQIFDNMTRSTGALDKAFAASSQTAEFKWNQALSKSKATMATLGAEIQQAVIPILEKLGDILEGVTEWFMGLDDSQKRLVVTVGGLAAAMGPLLLGLGKIASMAPTLISGLNGVAAILLKLKTLVLANPYVALAAGIAAVGVALYKFSTQSTEAEKQQERVNKAVQESIAPLQREQAEITTLIKRIQGAGEGTEARRRAIEQLNSVYPELLANYDKENISNEQLSGILNGVNQMFKERIKLQAMQGAMEQYNQEAIDAQTKIMELEAERADLLERSKTARSEGDIVDAELFLTGRKNLLKSIKEQEELINQSMEQYNKLSDAIDSMFPEGDTSAPFRRTIGVVAAEIEQVEQKLMKTKSLFDVYGEDSKAVQLVEKQLRNKLAALKDEMELLKGSTGEMELLGGSTGEESTTPIENQISAYAKLLEQRQKLADQIREMKALDPSADVTELAQAYTLLDDQIRAIDDSLQIVSEQQDAHVKQWQEMEESQRQFTEQAKQSLTQQVHQLERSLLTRKEAIELHYQEQLEMLRQASEMGIVIEKETYDRLKQMRDDQLTQLEERTEESFNLMAAMSEQFTNVFTDALSGMMNQMGNILAGGEANWADFGATVIQSLEQVLKSLFAQAAAAIISGETVRGMGLPGLAAGLVGVGLLKGVWNKHVANLQGLETGGNVIRSGAFLVGEAGPELVNLPAGSAVTPNHMLGAGGDIVATARLAGRDMEILLERVNNQTQTRRSIGK